MSTLSDTLKRIANALAYDNVGNLGELKRKLAAEEDASVSAERPRLRLVVNQHPMAHAVAAPVLRTAAR